MTCRACGATIAAKAIVCYKCGAPTEDHAPVPRAAAPHWNTVAVFGALGAFVLAIAAWFTVPRGADGDVTYPAVTAGMVAMIGLMFLMRVRRFK